MPLPIPTSRSEIVALQRQRKVAAVKNALRAPFHQKRLKGIDPDCVADAARWREIPLMLKEELRRLSPEQYFSDFCLAKPHEIAEYWRSGGVTGEPFFYPRTFADLPYCMLGFDRTFQCVGFEAGDTCHMSLPLGIHPAGQMWARSGQGLGIGMLWAGAGASTPSAVQLSLIERLKPTILLTMSSYGLHLANLAEAEGIDLRQSSVRKIMCTAEPLSQAKRKKLGSMWGAEVFDCFGMTEASMMAAEASGSEGYRTWTDLFFVEVIDPKTNEPVAEGSAGMLVVTPLWSFTGTPFLRWSSGDIVTCVDDDDTGPFGVFPLVKHTHRTTGFFKVRGINVGHSEFEDFMFRSADVADFKVEVVNSNDLDEFLISIEAATSIDELSIVESLREQTKQKFGLTPQIRLLPRGTLAREFEGAIKAPRFVDQRQRC
jgi:phenylacetate-CoA ligase